ncbi:hypothetical protein GCM10009827_013430 [Dactylosporangium maewongense]|uniref:Uncharacterized protein n=1 Tax=Dactylosporangium maewongense TaxID=634393 RepID=A0ABN1ZQK2_9ACTN
MSLRSERLVGTVCVLEVTAWLLFAGVVLALFFRPAPRTAVVARP